MTLPVVLTMLLAISSAFMGLMSLLYLQFPERRFYPEPDSRLRRPQFTARLVMTGIFSTAMTYALILGLGRYLIAGQLTAWWRCLVEVVAILMVYDLLYYCIHRFALHRWKVLMRVHAVHHQVLRPSPMVTLLLHPVENFLGLGLFVFTVWMFGPIDLLTFGVCFLSYSCVNIINHAGMDLPVPYLGMLPRKHNVHHKHMRAGNYATLSALPDLLFGTFE